MSKNEEEFDPVEIDMFNRYYHDQLNIKAAQDDISGTSELVISIDASNFERSSVGSGRMIFKCLNSVATIGVSINNVTPYGQFHFDRFVEHFDKQSDKSNIRIGMPCCILEVCPIRLFYEVLANNGELTERHRRMIKGHKSKVVKPPASCSVCGDKNNLKNCSRCKSVKYCSEVCQKKDWPEHKKSCGTTR